MYDFMADLRQEQKNLSAKFDTIKSVLLILDVNGICGDSFDRLSIEVAEPIITEHLLMAWERSSKKSTEELPSQLDKEPV